MAFNELWNELSWCPLFSICATILLISYLSLKQVRHSFPELWNLENRYLFYAPIVIFLLINVASLFPLTLFRFVICLFFLPFVSQFQPFANPTYSRLEFQRKIINMRTILDDTDEFSLLTLL